MKTINQILSEIEFPEDLKSLNKEELVLVANELRETIIEIISKNPGHFGSSLGAVELAVAIHFVFNTPFDKLVWDVGHQAYAHKLLTGRKSKFDTIRKFKGISGFPKMGESLYDNFGTGHSSTSISAILGMAIASKLDNNPAQHIAVIGDGALTGGLAFEALNNTNNDANVLIIINDNNMSIDENIGSLHDHLNTLPGVDKNFFETLNIQYFGPIDANNLYELIPALEEQKGKKGVRVLHCKTQKGFGYLHAEIGNETTWHAPGKFDPITGLRENNSLKLPLKYQDVLGNTLIHIAKKNKDVVAITPAMLSGSSLANMKTIYPNRVFDVGIAEQHAVTFSAGLASAGKIPYCVIYSSFLQRAYDQVIHDVALQNLPVIFCIDRAGLVGEDGATHHGVFDIAFLKCVPNLTLLAPINEHVFADMLYSVQSTKGPIAIRYPRGKGVMNAPKKEFHKLDLFKGRQLRKGNKVAILSIGNIGNKVIKALDYLENQNIFVSHYDMQTIKPLDKALIKTILSSYDQIVTIEEGVVSGGFGSGVLEFSSTIKSNVKIHIMGIPDQFIEHGSQTELYNLIGLDTEGIIKKIKAILE